MLITARSQVLILPDPRDTREEGDKEGYSHQFTPLRKERLFG
jgi:hypothetical protein